MERESRNSAGFGVKSQYETVPLDSVPNYMVSRGVGIGNLEFSRFPPRRMLGLA